jgi:tRNA(Ile)-lysidine synthase
VLMPAWEACFPGFRPMLARSARHAAQGQRLLDELAQLDLSMTSTPPQIGRLQSLTRDRQANALRHWLRSGAGVGASTAQLDELLDQIATCTTRGHRIHIKVGPGYVERDDERLRYTPTL